VCPVQLPGRGNRLQEPSFTRLVDLVQALNQALFPYFDKPFAFFGHSMGAMIAFELARSLRRDYGLEPMHLFVSGRVAPQIRRQEPITYDLPEPELLEELRRLNGTPKEVLEHPELMQLMLPLIRADFQVVQTYKYSPEPPLSCPISAFGGLQDQGVSRAALEAWREQTAATFIIRMFDGDHFFLHGVQPLFLSILAQELYGLVKSIG
ncbi:MAG TPA: alpha/beta fold hydrolase, partial [Blastocatellia bacterium]